MLFSWLLFNFNPWLAMVFAIHHRSVVPIMLLCAWLSCSAARLQADFEIESFTRYRIDNFDNNNNGYVDRVDDRNSSGNFESYAIAETIDNSSGLSFFSYVDPRLTRPLAMIDGNDALLGWGAVHVQFRTPGNFVSGFLDYSNPTASSAYGFDFDFDFDDLHIFNVSFAQMRGSSYMQSRGVQLERVFRFRPKDQQEEDKHAHPQSTWEFFYGVRFYQFDDSYTFDAHGEILGRTSSLTVVDNEHGGPHLGVGWNLSRGAWKFAVGGLMQAGLATTNSSQIGTFGEGLAPGGVNAIFAQPHLVNDQDDDQFASLYGELRAQAERQITDQITMSLGCSSYYFGDMKYADDSINWSLPDLGLADNGTKDELVTTAFVSLEFCH